MERVSDSLSDDESGWNCIGSYDGITGYEGEGIWNKFVKWHDDQFVFTASAHRHSPGTGNVTLTGENGKKVHNILSNYQHLTNSQYLRWYEFSPQQEKIYARTYNPVVDTWKNGTEHQFVMDYEDAGESYTKTVTGVANGSQVSAQFDLEPDKNYTWRVEVDDGYDTTESTESSFQTEDTDSNNPPSISSLTASPDPVNTGNTVNITADITDDGTVDTAWCTLKDADGNIEVDNVSMSTTSSDTYYCTHEPDTTGEWTAEVFANDTEGASTTDTTTFEVQQPPTAENLTFTRGTYVGDGIRSSSSSLDYSGDLSFDGFNSDDGGYITSGNCCSGHYIVYDNNIDLRNWQAVISNVSFDSNQYPFDIGMGVELSNGTVRNVSVSGDYSETQGAYTWQNLTIKRDSGTTYTLLYQFSTDGGDTIDQTDTSTIEIPNETVKLWWRSEQADRINLYEWERQVPTTGTYNPGEQVTTTLDAPDTDGTISSAELNITDADQVQQVIDATMTHGAFTTHHYTYDLSNDPADGTWTANARVTDNDLATDTASGTFTVMPIPDTVILEPGVEFTQPDNNAEITIEDQINVSSLAVWTDATEFGGANFSVSGNTSDAIDVNLSYFNRSVQDGYAANFSAATAAGNNVTFAFTNMVVDSFYDVFLDGMFDVERQSDSSGAFQFIETEWDGSYNQYSIQQSTNGRPALTSGLYRLDLAQSIERLEFGIDDRDEADIASHTGPGQSTNSPTAVWSWMSHCR